MKISDPNARRLGLVEIVRGSVIGHALIESYIGAL